MASKKLFSLTSCGDIEDIQVHLKDVKPKKERTKVVNSVNSEGWTILHVAVDDGDVEKVKWILSNEGGRAAGFKSVLARVKSDEDEMTALHRAAMLGHLEVFLAVVEGCRVDNGEREELLNAADSQGWTVLHYSANHGHSSIVSWLLCDSGGRAAGFNSVLYKGHRQETALHLAAGQNHVEAFRQLVLGSKEENGERTELFGAVDDYGYTALHSAASSNSISVIRWFTSEEAGACGSGKHCFAVSNNKMSVLHVFATGGCIECFDLIVGFCSNTSERLILFVGVDDKGWSIFHHAARCSEAEFILHVLRKYPEESKIIIDSRDNRGMTPLLRVIIGGVDEKSRKEWGRWQSQEAKERVIASLLGGSAAAERTEESSRVTADPNIDLKFS